jgi:hypothetical protein
LNAIERAEVFYETRIVAARPTDLKGLSERLSGSPDVRFGSQADICGAKAHVCFTPNSDHESGHRQTVMSALPPKADMCGAIADVR